MPKSTREAFGEILVQLGEKHPEIVVLDADLSKSTMTGAFAKKFPERHFELGIAEANMIGIASGLALSGLTPFAASFACFLIGRYETIRVSVGYSQANVKLVGTHAGLGIGEDGYSQMGLEDLAMVRALPNFVVLQPADATEAYQMVEWAVQHVGPVYFRLTRQKLEDVHDKSYRFRCGKGSLLYQPSGISQYSATIFASGGTVANALGAAKSLQSQDRPARMVNLSTLKPVDEELILSCAKDSERFVTVEDHSIIGGLGSAVCEVLAEHGAPIPVLRLGAKTYGESGNSKELYEKHGLSPKHIIQAVLSPVSSLKPIHS